MKQNISLRKILSLIFLLVNFCLLKSQIDRKRPMYRLVDINLISNTAIGPGVLGAITTGVENTALGRCALAVNTTGNSNTALGVDSLINNISGGGNTATGALALRDNMIGNSNTANGVASLIGRLGSGNTAVGAESMAGSGSGNKNTAIGWNCGTNLVNGDSNIYVGANSGPGSSTSESNVIRIGSEDVSEKPIKCFIQGIKGATTNSITPNVRVGSDGQLFEVITGSSKRYKRDIKDIKDESKKLRKLRPVSFKYKKNYDQKQSLYYGLIAEEVIEHMPELVEYDKNGQPDSVKYNLLNSLMLNEINRLQRKEIKLKNRVKKLETIVNDLKNILVNRKID